MNQEQLFALLDDFQIEVPSWGFADTGTRFGKFLQAAAASTIEEKLEDAGTVHRYTGCCPRWPSTFCGISSPAPTPSEVAEIADRKTACASARSTRICFKIKCINSARQPARIPLPAPKPKQHVQDCIAIGKATNSDLLSLWFADGTNYPGQDDIVTRKRRMEDALKTWHDAMPGFDDDARRIQAV